MKGLRYCGNCNPDEDPGSEKALEELFLTETRERSRRRMFAGLLSKKELDARNDPGVIVVSSRE
jgi:hypothetical protein